MFLEDIILLFSKDALKWSKVTVKDVMMLQTILFQNENWIYCQVCLYNTRDCIGEASSTQKKIKSKTSVTKIHFKIINKHIK